MMEILELAFQDGLNPKKVAATNGGEYHSPCPGCGGKDRFIVWNIQNRYYCRRCEKNGDVIQYFRDFHDLSFKESCERANITVKQISNIKRKKIDPFRPIKRKPINSKWQRKAFDFVEDCHRNLLTNDEALFILKERGLTLNSIRKFQLGWNIEDIYSDWKIEEIKRKIWIPKGIVIPSFLNGYLNKVKIRRSNWDIDDVFPKYVEIHGSASVPAIYGLNYNLPAIIIESELDAILVQQEAEDLCFSVALGGATKKPDTYLNSLLIKSPMALLSLDYDEAGIRAFKWWKNRYKNLFIWVPYIEKSIGDAFKKGLDIRTWIFLGIKEYTKHLKILKNEVLYDYK